MNKLKNLNVAAAAEAFVRVLEIAEEPELRCTDENQSLCEEIAIEIERMTGRKVPILLDETLPPDKIIMVDAAAIRRLA